MIVKENEIDEKKFKRFFFYGIENKRELIEGLLYISYKKVFESHKGEEWREVSKEEVEKDMVEATIRPYRQFYRFVTLNDKPKMVGETIIANIPEVNSEVLKQELEKEMQLLKAERKILDTKAGLFFARERENLLTGGQRYIYGKGLQGEEGWTKQVYRILEKLEKIEQQDGEKYQDYLWLTKFARAINRHNREEAEVIKQRMRERKKQEEEKEISM